VNERLRLLEKQRDSSVPFRVARVAVGYHGARAQPTLSLSSSIDTFRGTQYATWSADPFENEMET